MTGLGMALGCGRVGRGWVNSLEKRGKCIASEGAFRD